MHGAVVVELPRIGLQPQSGPRATQSDLPGLRDADLDPGAPTFKAEHRSAGTWLKRNSGTVAKQLDPEERPRLPASNAFPFFLGSYRDPDLFPGVHAAERAE